MEAKQDCSTTAPDSSGEETDEAEYKPQHCQATVNAVNKYNFDYRLNIYLVDPYQQTLPQ